MGSLSIWHWLIMLVLIGLLYTVYRWCLSYKLLLIALGDKYEKFSPNLAFLLLVPVIGLFWWVYMAFHIKASLNDRRDSPNLRPSNDGGFIYSLVSVASAVVSVIPHRDEPVGWVAVVSVVFWILSWIKVVNTRKSISQTS